MFNRNIFASRLKSLRTTAGLSGLDLSHAVGLKNRGSIAQFETCRTTPSADVLVALADFFCVAVDYLAGRDDDPQKEKYIARAEDALDLVRERASTTLAAIGEAVITTDAAGHVMYMNRAAEELLGMSLEQLVTSELVQHQLAGARVVKAFNHIPAAEILSTARPAGASDRRALIVAGDDD